MPFFYNVDVHARPGAAAGAGKKWSMPRLREEKRQNWRRDEPIDFARRSCALSPHNGREIVLRVEEDGAADEKDDRPCWRFAQENRHAGGKKGPNRGE